MKTRDAVTIVVNKAKSPLAFLGNAGQDWRMIFEETIAIPQDRTLHLDLVLPKTMPCGTTLIKLIPQASSTMLISEAALAKDWNSPDEDLAWQSL
jgi:hypothetical protein